MVCIRFNVKGRKRLKKFMIVAVNKFMLIVILIAVLTLVPVVRLASENKDALKAKFIGKQAEYQGVLTLWNIDTFEGGNLSKSSFLLSTAAKFEKKNKGALIKVENLSIDQMQESLKQGILPDMVSFGTGLGKYFVQDLVPFDQSFESLILPNFYSSGLYNLKQVAVAFIAGGYVLLSSTEKIQAAGKDNAANLKELALSLNYTKKLRKKEQNVYSITFGQNEYTGAFDVFSRTFTDVSLQELVQSGVVDEKYKSQSPYQAYVGFVSGDSSVLLGTQRDIIRLQGRVLAGKQQDLLCQPLGAYTDLVQYIGLCTDQDAKYKVCCEFVKFLLSDDIQKSLLDAGMLSPTGLKIYNNGEPLHDLEMAVDEKMVVRACF